MNPELVLSEDQKQIRFRKLLLKKKKGSTTKIPSRKSIKSTESSSSDISSSSLSTPSNENPTLIPKEMSRQELSRLDSFNTFRDFKSDRDDLDDLLDEVADADDDDEDDFSINDDVSKNDDDCKNDDVSIKVENIVKSYEIAIQQQSGGKSSEVSNLLHFFIYSKLL